MKGSCQRLQQKGDVNCRHKTASNGVVVVVVGGSGGGGGGRRWLLLSRSVGSKEHNADVVVSRWS